MILIFFHFYFFFHPYFFSFLIFFHSYFHTYFHSYFPRVFQVSKGCLKAIEILEIQFPDLVLVAISGNMCTDKKPSAINWYVQHVRFTVSYVFCIFRL